MYTFPRRGDLWRATLLVGAASARAQPHGAIRDTSTTALVEILGEERSLNHITGYSPFSQLSDGNSQIGNRGSIVGAGAIGRRTIEHR